MKINKVTIVSDLEVLCSGIQLRLSFSVLLFTMLLLGYWIHLLHYCNVTNEKIQQESIVFLIQTYPQLASFISIFAMLCYFKSVSLFL